MSPSHVLVPLDGSDLADDALAHAVETFDCRITVLNVVTLVDGAMSEGADLAADRDRIEEARDRTNALVAEVRAQEGPDRAIETVVETGDPAETILAYADTHGVDHIVMGSHGRDGGELTRRLLGTVSTAVLGEAAVPVTVVR